MDYGPELNTSMQVPHTSLILDTQTPTTSPTLTFTPSPVPTATPEPTATIPPTSTPYFGQSFVIGYSVNGLPLEVYQFGNGPRERMIVAGIHGGYEWNTVALAEEHQ